MAVPTRHTLAPADACIPTQKGRAWRLLLSSLGSTDPVLCLFLGSNKQGEAFVGACCVLPAWLVLWTLNTSLPTAPRL